MHKHVLLNLDADTRAFALVGAYMGTFALLEQGIDTALGEVMGVAGLRRAIVARNMGFDDKIKTLRTLVDLFIHTGAEKKRFDELAKSARKCGETRNIVAHTPFRKSSKSDGVEFFPISATSKLTFPDMDWSVDEFLKQIDNIQAIDNGLRAIDRQMSFQRVAEALMQTSEAGKPGPMKGALGGLFGLGASLLQEEADGAPPHEEQD